MNHFMKWAVLWLLVSSASAWATPAANTIIVRPRQDPVAVNNTVTVDIIANGMNCIHDVLFRLHFNIDYPNPSNLQYIGYQVGSLFQKEGMSPFVFVTDSDHGDRGEYPDDNIYAFIDTGHADINPACSSTIPTVNAPPDGEVVLSLNFRVLGGTYANLWFTERMMNDPAFAPGLTLSNGWTGNSINTSANALPGDVTRDGQVTSLDASWISKQIVGSMAFDDRKQSLGDVNYDSVNKIADGITSLDATLVRRYIVGLVSTLSSPPLNNSPIADAGRDQRMPIGATVQLNGSGSSDIEDGTNLVYTWQVVSQPTGSPAISFLPSNAVVSPTFVLPNNASYVGDYIVRLTAQDRGLTGITGSAKLSIDTLAIRAVTPRTGNFAASGAPAGSAVFLSLCTPDSLGRKTTNCPAPISNGIVSLYVYAQNVSNVSAIPFHVKRDPSFSQLYSFTPGKLLDGSYKNNGTPICTAIVSAQDRSTYYDYSFLPTPFENSSFTDTSRMVTLNANDQLVQKFTYAKTTVNIFSAAGQNILKVASSAGFASGDRIAIDFGGPDQEIANVSSIQAAVSTNSTLAASVGQTYISVASTTGFSVGNVVTLLTTSPLFRSEEIPISSIGTGVLNFSRGIWNDYPSGSSVNKDSALVLAANLAKAHVLETVSKADKAISLFVTYKPSTTAPNAPLIVEFVKETGGPIVLKSWSVDASTPPPAGDPGFISPPGTFTKELTGISPPDLLPDVLYSIRIRHSASNGGTYTIATGDPFSSRTYYWPLTLNGTALSYPRRQIAGVSVINGRTPWTETYATAQQFYQSPACIGETAGTTPLWVMTLSYRMLSATSASPLTFTENSLLDYLGNPTPNRSTTTSGASAAAQSALNVTSTTGFAVGHHLLLGYATPSQEIVTVTAIPSGTQFTVSLPLQFNHASGEPIYQVARWYSGSVSSN